MAVKKPWVIAAFLLPTLLFYAYFFIVPVFETVYNSFFEWNGMADKVFIFFQNYITLFQDEIFYRALFNSFYWVFLVIVVQVPIGFTLAYFLYTKVKGFKFLRTVYFVPGIISTVSVSLVFSFIYEPNFGILNSLLINIGLENLTTSWLSNPATGITAVSVPFVWMNIGLMMVLSYAGLQGIPDEILEAGEIDGVGPFQRVFYIIIPMIWNVLIVCLVLGITFAFKMFDFVLLLTEGGPIHRTEVTGSYMYYEGFEKMNYGYGNSIAVSMMVIVLLIAFIINKGLKSKEG